MIAAQLHSIEGAFAIQPRSSDALLSAVILASRVFSLVQRLRESLAQIVELCNLSDTVSIQKQTQRMLRDQLRFVGSDRAERTVFFERLRPCQSEQEPHD